MSGPSRTPAAAPGRGEGRRGSPLARRAAAAAVLALAAVAAGPAPLEGTAAGPASPSLEAVVQAGCDRAADRSARTEASAADTTEIGSLDPREILRRARERYGTLESLRAQFRERVQVPLLDRDRSGRGTWYQKGRGLFKLDYAEPPEDVIVSDGTHVWTYYPSSQPGQVTRAALEQSDRGREMVDLMGRIFREARQGYEAEYVGLESAGGVETHHVVLTPTGEAPYRRVELWISPEDDLVRRFEVTEENETVRTVTLTDPEPDAQIPDSVFRFEVPEGVEVFSG